MRGISRSRTRIKKGAKPPFGEADDLIAGDNQVIDDADIRERQALAQPLGDDLVRLGRLGHPTWMRVYEDDYSGIALQSLLNHLPRMHRGPIDGALEQLDEFDEPMTVVEEKTAEGLELAGTESEPKEIPHHRGRGERCTAPESLSDVLPGGSQDPLGAGRDGMAGGIEREQTGRVQHGHFLSHPWTEECQQVKFRKTNIGSPWQFDF